MKISWLIFYVYKLEYIFRIFKHIILFFLIMSTQLIMSIYPVLWPPHMKSWLIGKHSDAGRDWGQEEKGTTEDEMAGWHHWLDGREFEWTPGDGDGQGGLECCDSWGHKESDRTEQRNWTELNWDSILKSRDITLPTKVCLVKAMVFPVVMYGCESWTVKKAECRRIDAFELWYWRRLLRVS